MRVSLWIPALAAACSFACDSTRVSSEAPAAEGMKSPAGTHLAYEHTVEIEIDEKAIPVRLAASQSACLSQRLGDCAVLGISQVGGNSPAAALTVRIVPAGVEPLAALAGEGGEVASRETRAEDLAEAAADNAGKSARLEKELARLDAFAARKDLAAADLIALTKQIAENETQLEEVRRDAAHQQRRTDTNLLTLRWRPPGGDRATSEIGRSLSDAGETFASGVATAIDGFAYLTPIALAIAPPMLLLRWWLRRGKRSG